MGELIFLQVGIDGKTYLCPESSIDRVLRVRKEETFETPYGPESLKYLFKYGKEVVPLFGPVGLSRDAEATVVLIIRRLLDICGLIVDGVMNFVKIEKDVIDSSVEVPAYLSRKAVNVNGCEYYLLDIDALFGGKE